MKKTHLYAGLFAASWASLGALGLKPALAQEQAYSEQQAPEEFQGTWLAETGKEQAKFVISATTLLLYKNGKREWDCRIVSWHESPHTGKNYRQYPFRIDMRLKVGERTGPFQIFVDRDRKRFVMKSWMSVHWDHPFAKKGGS